MTRPVFVSTCLCKVTCVWFHYFTLSAFVSRRNTHAHYWTIACHFSVYLPFSVLTLLPSTLSSSTFLTMSYLRAFFLSLRTLASVASNRPFKYVYNYRNDSFPPYLFMYCYFSLFWWFRSEQRVFSFHHSLQQSAAYIVVTECITNFASPVFSTMLFPGRNRPILD